MVKQSDVLDRVDTRRDQQLVGTYAEGIRAGLAGAVTIAVWFGLLDLWRGHPLFTPTVLGSAIFRGGAGLDDPANLAPSFEMVVSFTWVHMLVFLLVGMGAALLLERAERDSHAGFGILLLFFIFEAGFMAACMLFAEPVLQALTWPAIAVGNLLAALVMGAIFWRAHPSLTVQP
jgi:hypothetical protein